MKVQVRKSKKVSSKAYAKATLAMPLHLRIYNNIDMNMYRQPVSRHRQLLRQYKNWRPKFAWRQTEWLSFAKPAMAAFLLLTLLGYAGMFQVAQAYFNTVLVSRNNTVMAGTLDFTVAVNGSASSTGLQPDQTVSKDVSIMNNGNIKFQYKLTSQQVSGSSDLCRALNLRAVLDGTEYYNSTLLDLVTSNIQFDADAGNWQFTVSLPSDVPASLSQQTCGYKIIFSGWQWNLPGSSAGFVSTGETEFSIGSGQWEDPTLPDEGILKSGDVIINEIMWMGSRDNDKKGDPDDEWIELRNMTDREIDISNWNIYGAVKGESGHLEISGKHSIPARGYFLIANYDTDKSLINVKVDLVKTNINFDNEYDDNGQIILTAKDVDMVMDKTPVPIAAAWPAGKHKNDDEWSMERNNNPGDGVLSTSWHTCDSTIMSAEQLTLMQGYWDGNATKYNCGTPGAANLSKNDPTAPDYQVLNGGALSGPTVQESEEPQETIEPVKNEAILPDANSQALTPKPVEPPVPDTTVTDGEGDTAVPDANNTLTGTDPAAGGDNG